MAANVSTLEKLALATDLVNARIGFTEAFLPDSTLNLLLQQLFRES